VNQGRELVHQVNGQFLEALRCLWLQGVEFTEAWKNCYNKDEKWSSPWDDFIINMILLRRRLGQIETIILQTSATVCLGEKFFESDWCHPKKNVKSLDGEVPLDRSVSGYCIQTGDTVWLEDLNENSPDPAVQLYRSFGYVAVVSKKPPTSEFVFPIQLRTGLSGSLLGVVNCEWFGETKKCPFVEHGANRTTKDVSDLINIHAPFLATALKLENFPVDKIKEAIPEHYLAFHRAVMRHHTEKKGVSTP
jgi:hypothetical protein